MVIVIIIAALLTGLLVGESLYNNQSRTRFIFKISASLSFVVLAIVIVLENGGNFEDQYPISIIIALAMSFLGDFGLGQYHLINPINKIHKKHWQEIGFVFFSLSQLIYVLTFFNLFKFYSGYLLIPFIGVITMFTIVNHLKVFDKKRTIIIITYTVLLTGMLATSWSSAQYLNFNQLGIVLCVAGSLFAISDFTLIFKYYYHKARKLTTVTSCLTYYAAQLLFAFSIYLFLI